MKMIKKIIVTIMLMSLLTIFCSCSNTEKKANVEVQISYAGEVEGDELFFSIYPEYQKAPEGKKMIKLLCTFTNIEEAKVSALNVESSSNEKIETHYGCVDLEPTFPIYKNNPISSELYAFVNENMTDEEIEKELENTTFTFSCYYNDLSKSNQKMYFEGVVTGT